MALADQPTFTETVECADEFYPESGALYVYAATDEERAHLPSACSRPSGTVECLEVTVQDRTSIAIRRKDTTVVLGTRAPNKTAAFVRGLPDGCPLYLDITGLAHATWAPLVRACRDAGRTLRVVYIEPIEYARAPIPTEGEIYDLSERIEGIRPIPGFSRLTGGDSQNDLFIPLLGFEGSRFSYVREKVQPRGDNTIPVVGIPGFRPEFPFATYLGNRVPLLEARTWSRTRCAQANCPFSVYYVLDDLREMNPGQRLKIAPIGTKPHGLGAVLFALQYPEVAELVYDHPVRKAGRTSGSARALIYYVSEFWT